MILFSTAVPLPPATVASRAFTIMPVLSALIASPRKFSSRLNLPMSFTLVVESLLFSTLAARGLIVATPPLRPSAVATVIRLLPAWISMDLAFMVSTMTFTSTLLLAVVLARLVPEPIAPTETPLMLAVPWELS